MHRAKLDKNDKLNHWCETLEKVIVDTVESGFYTKDLAISVTGDFNVSSDKYLTTE